MVMVMVMRVNDVMRVHVSAVCMRICTARHKRQPDNQKIAHKLFHTHNSTTGAVGRLVNVVSVGLQMEPTFFFECGADGFPVQTVLGRHVPQCQQHAFFHAF